MHANSSRDGLGYMSDSRQTTPSLGFLFAGAMFIAMGFLSIVIDVPVLAWSFLPMGAFLIVIWFANRTKASRDDVGGNRH